MKFEYRHTFDASLDDLISAMLDPELPAVLVEKMSTIIDITVLDRREEEDQIIRRVKYVPEPIIKKIGTKKITPEAMQWIEESTFDRRSQIMTFDNIPTHPKIRAKMTNHGRMAFRALGTKRAERVMTGELTIKFPILGRIAEGVIAKNAKKILDEEAAVVSDWLRSR